MSQVRDHYRWYDAAQGLFSGTLPAAEAAEFAELLATNAEAYEFYLQLVRLEVALEWHCGSSQPPVVVPTPETPPATPQPVAVESGCNVGISSRRTRSAPAQRGWLHRAARRVFRPTAWSILGCGVGFVAYVTLISWGMLDEKHRPPRHAIATNHERPTTDDSATDVSTPEAPAAAPQVATIRDTQDARWQAPEAPDRQPELGDPKSEIAQGEPLHLASGLVAMELKRGVKLVIEGPARWSIDGGNRATLHRGKLVAHVPQQATGFTLKTPTATVVDLGTEFGVFVSDAGQTDVAVTSGAVQLASITGAPTRLTEGHSLRFDSQGTVVAQANDGQGSSQFDDLVTRVRSGLRPTSDLWVYESFSEPRDATPLNGRQEGLGFNTIAWVAPVEGGIGHYPAFTLRNVNIAIGSCFPRGVSFLPTLGILEHCDTTSGLRYATRYLPRPVDLGVDAEYYVSFIATKYGNNCYGTVGLVGNATDSTLEAGWRYSGSDAADPFVLVSPRKQASSTEARFAAGGAVAFFVLRIVARASEPDSASLYVFRPSDTIPATVAELTDAAVQPEFEVVSLPEFESSLQLDQLLLSVDGPRSFVQFDEIRLGTTWQAVTGVKTGS